MSIASEPPPDVRNTFAPSIPERSPRRSRAPRREVGEVLEHVPGGELAHLLRGGVRDLGSPVSHVAVPEAARRVDVAPCRRGRDGGALGPGDDDLVARQRPHVGERLPQAGLLAHRVVPSWSAANCAAHVGPCSHSHHSTEQVSCLRWPRRTHVRAGLRHHGEPAGRCDAEGRFAEPRLKKERSRCRSLDICPAFPQESMSDDSAYTAEPTPPRRPLAALFDASRALGAAASLLDAAPSALRAVGGACDADLAVLWWEDRAFERLRRVATWRPFTTVDDRVVRLDGREHVRIGEDAPGRVWESGRAEQRRGRGRRDPDPHRPPVVGVLEAHRPAGAFTDGALAALEGLAAQFGVLARASRPSRRFARRGSLRPAGGADPRDRLHGAPRPGPDRVVRQSPRVEGMLGIRPRAS